MTYRKAKLLSVLPPVSAAAAVAVVASPAAGGLTTISGPDGEASHLDIFDAVYGSGAVVERVDDSEDISFGFDAFSARSIARFAALDQSFGYVDGDGDFQLLFEETGKDFDVTGSVGVTSLDGPVNFARLGSNGLASSDPTANSDGQDHVVTYKVTDGLDDPFYVLFFEDLFGAAADNDFQDFVVEVRGINAAPTPAAAGLGFAMMGVLAARRRRRDA